MTGAVNTGSVGTQPADPIGDEGGGYSIAELVAVARRYDSPGGPHFLCFNNGVSVWRALADTIERLEKERDGWEQSAKFLGENFDLIVDERNQLKAERDKMRTALAPFRTLSEFVKNVLDDGGEIRTSWTEDGSHLTSCRPGGANHSFMLGHFALREVRAALTEGGA